MIVTYEDRMKLVRLFLKWTRENNKEISLLNLIAWMQLNYLLNKEKVKSFLESQDEEE